MIANLTIKCIFGLGISTNSQAPSTKQFPITKIQNHKQNRFDNLNISDWSLFGILSLGFGILYDNYC